jgi:hypothetical protein
MLPTTDGHEADALLNHEVMADPLNALFENETRDAQSYDLLLELEDGDTQDEVAAPCGCLLERTEYLVGFIFCDRHRAMPLSPSQPEAPKRPPQI